MHNYESISITKTMNYEQKFSSYVRVNMVKCLGTSISVFLDMFKVLKLQCIQVVLSHCNATVCNSSQQVNKCCCFHSGHVIYILVFEVHIAFVMGC